MNDDLESLEAFYDDVADTYGDAVTDAPIRRDCRLPTVYSLFPDVTGKRVLEAACGAGTDAAWLAEQGADVLGIDASEAMVQTAREQFSDRATFRQHDLGEPLTFLDDGEIDVVSSQLTLSHLREWEPVLTEFERVLAPDGVLIASTDHPFRQFLLTSEGRVSDIDLYAAESEPDVRTETAESNYYETERYELAYGADDSHRISFFRRPMSEYLQSFLDAGFELENVVEPTLSDEFKRNNPTAYEDFLHRVPDFLCLRASV